MIDSIDTRTASSLSQLNWYGFSVVRVKSDTVWEKKWHNTNPMVMKKTCYMCAAKATTREHVPPKSFFPRRLRTNLIVVPSCVEHNNDNSDDVEYIRNVLALGPETVQLTGGEIRSKTDRSLRRSRRLRRVTFSEMIAVRSKGQLQSAIKIQLPALNRVMRAIAFALHYHDFGKRYEGRWTVLPAWGFRPPPIGYEDMAALHEVALSAFKSAPFNPPLGSAPSVFRYCYWNAPTASVLYELCFYGSFYVFVVYGDGPLPFLSEPAMIGKVLKLIRDA